MSRQFKLMFIFLLMLSSALIGVSVFADDYGLGATAQEAGLAKYESNLPKLVGQVVGAALSLTGVLFFGLMIYSGIIWMIDRGNDERAEQAKNTITAAIIGLVIVLAAYAITKFAFGAVPQSGGGGNVAKNGDQQGPTALCCSFTPTSAANASGAGFQVVADSSACMALCDSGGPGQPSSCIANSDTPVADCQNDAPPEAPPVGPKSCSRRSDCENTEVCKGADLTAGATKTCVGALGVGTESCCVEGISKTYKGTDGCGGYVVQVPQDQCQGTLIN